MVRVRTNQIYGFYSQMREVLRDAMKDLQVLAEWKDEIPNW